MKKYTFDVQSNAIKKTARGLNNHSVSDADRARIVYGLSNFALQKSPDKLRETWISVSKNLRKT